MHRIAGLRSVGPSPRRRRATTASPLARGCVGLAALAIALAAVPLGSAALERSADAPDLVAAASAAPAPAAQRADERIGNPPPRFAQLDSPHAPLRGAAERGWIAAHPAAADGLASRPLVRWTLSHGTTTSLP